MELISPIATSASNPSVSEPVAMPTASSLFALSGESHLAEEQLMTILQYESTYQVHCIPCQLLNIQDGDSRPVPYDDWRRKICQWSFKVIDHFGLDREVVSRAMNMLDRFLVAYEPKVPQQDKTSCPCPSCRRPLDSRTFQLAAMTSLYLAIKMQANPPASSHVDDCVEFEAVRSHKKLRLLSFVELSRGQFNSEDLCQMERTLLDTLQWKVNPPSATMLVSYLLRLMPPRESIPLPTRNSYSLVLHVLSELARYLTELSVCLGGSYHRPSQVAYASILVAMDLLTYSALPFQLREAFQTAVYALTSTGNGTVLYRNQEMDQLCHRLGRSFCPELLLDDFSDADGHPISIARECGLLLLETTPAYTPSPSTPTSSPKRFAKTEDPQRSPVSVVR